MTMGLCGTYRIMLFDDKRTTKCRIVFDGSAREGGDAPLNDRVLPGPALQPNLVSVLIRFGTHKIGLIADTQKMSMMKWYI